MSQKTRILVVGAGPVGLTLSMELAVRGIDVLVVETRARNEAPSIKCNHVSARSMEIFRALGLAGAVRKLGLPEDYQHSISYRTTTVGQELTKIHIPCRRDRFTDKTGPDGNWPTPEPPHRVNQIFLEPALFAHAEAMDRITILSRCEMVDFTQHSDGVTAEIRDHESGEILRVDAAFMVGCDGAKSKVRKAIGAKFEGDAVVQRVQSTLIRAPHLIAAMREEPAWAMFSLNPRRQGNVYAIDGRKLWLVHNYLRLEEEDFDTPDRDGCIRDILGVGKDFAYETVSREDWFGRRLVANKFREGRVFICGDAAHIWVPYAGYGMNAGIADASNLAWLLAAHLQGWAPYSILSAHEAERHPITEQVGRFAMKHAIAMASQRSSVPENIEEASAEGEEARAALGRQAYDLNVQQYACSGLNFGYYYDKSPIIAYDGGVAPEYSMGRYTPSTVPGARLPHVFLEHGRSLYDLLGHGFTLFRLNPHLEVDALTHAAGERTVPLAVHDLPQDIAGSVYEHALVIARSDAHVVWRGNKVPDDPLALIDMLRGAH
ncbi:FAD-dependent oxidoreductase [Marivita sp.]|uniref:FAD-dependent oxidoreductase n=1 Tax=Marivita sp. TaxID=2003365 RepID=UPI002629AC7E|nr:FAD-dependent oxidoreductase [Marivita sp.]